MKLEMSVNPQIILLQYCVIF